MDKKIKFIISGIEYAGTIDTTNCPRTASALFEALPIESSVTTWGKEIYFDVPIDVELENETIDVAIGDVAFWPPGNVLCIFFGPTPASATDSPTPASAVNVIGRIESIEGLESFKDGARIRVEKV